MAIGRRWPEQRVRSVGGILQQHQGGRGHVCSREMDVVSAVTFLMVILTVSHPSPYWSCYLFPFTESICIVGYTPWCRIPADMGQLESNCLMLENTTFHRISW